jgi:hypothetical protein
MARTARSFTMVSLAVGAVAAAAVLAVSRAAGASESTTVVLHIENCAGVSDPDLRVATAEVARIYRSAGVQIAWSNEPLPTGISSRGATDEPRHLALILHDDGARMLTHAYGAPDSTLGFAAHDIGRAYVSVNRVAAESARRAVDHRWVLGWVIAHEVGHLLLPRNSHSSEGIMRAAMAFDFAIGRSHDFTGQQCATIRAALGR